MKVGQPLNLKKWHKTFTINIIHMLVTSILRTQKKEKNEKKIVYKLNAVEVPRMCT